MKDLFKTIWEASGEDPIPTVTQEEERNLYAMRKKKGVLEE
jgi:hypothetical protein